MSRLTELIDIDGMKIKTSKERPLSNQGLGAILHKLYAFENLEDELGIPLDIVLNLIKNTNKLDKESRTQDIYFDYKGQLIEASFLTLGFEYNEFVFYVHTSLPDSEYDFETMTLKVKDYGKTWWLKGDRSE